MFTFFITICNFIRLSKILHPNIGLSVFDPKYEIKCEIRYLLNSFAYDKVNETKETDENSPNKKKKIFKFK